MKTSSTVGTPGAARGVAASDDTGLGGAGPVIAEPGADPEASERGTRQRVLTSILEHGPSTAVDLGDRLALTPAAIRRHLTSLSDAGLVTSREQRVYGHRGRGRPAKVFLLTDAGRSSFPQAYDRLANDAISLMIDAAGPQVLAELAERRVRDIESAYQRLRVEQPDADPVETLAHALNEAGYVTSIEPVASGEQLCQHHCPVAQVAARHPELCAAETQLFSRLLDSHVQRLATIAHGEGVCTTHVPGQVLPGQPRPPVPAASSRPPASALLHAGHPIAHASAHADQLAHPDQPSDDRPSDQEGQA